MTTSFELNDGATIPWLGFGTGTAFWGQDAKNAVVQAIQAGVTHLDGAQMYKNEETLGAGIIEAGVPREKLFITTKLNELPEGKTVRETLVESLKKLGVDCVDLFLIHSPHHHPRQLLEVWKALEDAKRDGLAKSIGVSNTTVKDLQQILDTGGIVPAVNQIEYHPYVAKAADPIVEFCQGHGILVESFGGLSPVFRVKDGPVAPVLARVRERLEKTRGAPVTEAQVLLKWVAQKGIVNVTTTSKTERLKEYQDVVNIPVLTDEEHKAISDAGYKEHHRFFMKHLDKL